MNFLFLLLNEIKFFTNFKNKMYQFLIFFQPLMFLSIIYFLNQIRGGINIDRFIIASTIISMWSYVLYSSGSALINEKWSDTLKMLIASPTSLFRIVLSKTLSNSLVAVISLLLNFLYSIYIFNFEITIQHYGLFSLAILVFIITLSVVGLILSIVFGAFQNVFAFQNLILTPMILLCGVFITTDNFPMLVKLISYLIPMTWGVSSIYDSILISQSVYINMAIAIFTSSIYLLLAYFMFNKIEIILRKTGRWGAI